HRARARLPEECPDPHSRRAHELGRSAHRGGDPGSTGAADARPYDLPDHAPGERAHGVRHAAASGAGPSRGGDAVAAASAKMSRKPLVAVRSDNLAAHPAVAAWRQLTPDAPDPGRIEVLRQGKKSTTYRLVESTPGGASIIAQRACMAKALIERTVYEEILPHLPVTSPRYHGFRTENPHFAWLFLEDVGDERYATSDREQYALAGRWLGLMHTSTTRCADAATAAARLPDGGPARYLQHLRAARANILCNICNPALTTEEIALLKTIVSQHD